MITRTRERDVQERVAVRRARFLDEVGHLRKIKLTDSSSEALQILGWLNGGMSLGRIQRAKYSREETRYDAPSINDLSRVV